MDITVPWDVVYGVVAVSIIACNSFILFVFSTSRRLRRMRTTLFLIGLTAADLIVGAVAIPMYMAILWPGSEVANSEAFFLSYYIIEIMSSFASLLLLAVIALERVYSVFWPFKHRALSRTPYQFALVASWFPAVLQMILKLLHRYGLVTSQEYFYTVFAPMVAVVIIIIVSYVAMWRKRKRGRVVGPRWQMMRDEQERKLAKTLAILTAIFLITWLPFSAVISVTFMNGLAGSTSSFRYKVWPHLVYASKLLHYSNSLANPILYSFRFPEVRGTLAKVCCAHKRQVPPTDFQMTPRGGEGGRE